MAKCVQNAVSNAASSATSDLPTLPVFLFLASVRLPAPILRMLHQFCLWKSTKPHPFSALSLRRPVAHKGIDLLLSVLETPQKYGFTIDLLGGVEKEALRHRFGHHSWCHFKGHVSQESVSNRGAPGIASLLARPFECRSIKAYLTATPSRNTPSLFLSCRALSRLGYFGRELAQSPHCFGLQPVMQRLTRKTQGLGHRGDRLPSKDKPHRLRLNSSVYRARTIPVI